MIITFYENYKGGVNNLCVAQDTKTGEFATSFKGKERAVKNLNKTLKRRTYHD